MLEGGDPSLVEDFPAAEDAGLGVADDPAVLDVAAGDGPDLGDLEDLADLGPAQEGLLDDRLEEADDGLLELVGELVDDLVGPDLDAFFL